MASRFVIITAQRSGSNMLTSLLDDHPQIACWGELMRPTPRWMRKQGYRGALKVLDRLDARYRDDSVRFAYPYDFVESVYGLPPASGAEAVGFKLHIDQHREFLERLIDDPAYKLVILQRENVLAQYSSWLIAEETGQGNARKGDAIKRARVHFGRRQFRGYVNRMQRHFEWTRSAIEKTGKSPFELRYTQLNDPARLAELIAFLGGDSSIVPEPSTAKRNPSDILDRFDNPGEVERELKRMGCPHWVTETPEGTAAAASGSA